jgi:hypothetical protein
VPESPASRFSGRVHVVAVGRSRYVVSDPDYYYSRPGTGVTMMFTRRWDLLRKLAP